ncbi:MAG: ABC transporter substrate-binding protein [Nitrospinota bacterium]
MKPIIYRCLIVILLAIPIFSCVKKGGSEKTTVRFLNRPDNGGGWKELIERFEKKHPDIDIDLVEGPDSTNIRENMYSTSFLAGESTYDLAFMDIIWVSKFAQAGWIEPLDNRFTLKMQKEFLPGDIAGSIYNGNIYRVPMRTDAGMLYYRKDILKQAGLSPPETWDEFVDIALKLQSPPDVWGFVFQGKQYEGLICNFLELVWGAGGDILDEKGIVRIDGPEAISALQWMSDILNRYKICPPGVTTYQEEESRHIFHEGRAIFMRNWPYAWTLSQKDGSPIQGKIGIIPMVHKKGGKSAATLGGWGFGISRFSKNKEAAWKFIRFATGYEGQKILHFKNGAIPTRHKLFKDKDILAESPYYPDLYKVLLTARPRPSHPRYSQISDILQVYVSKAIVGQETPDIALKEAAKEIRRLINR